MKNFKILSLSVLALELFQIPFASANTVTPSSLKMTGYELWASTSTDCSSPVKVINNGTSGKSIDIALSTDFGSATLPPDGV